MNYKLLKRKSFFLLMQGSLVSQIGSMMQTFALSLFVLSKYDSASLFASILMVSALPRLIIGPFVGVFVDWFDRKKIIVRFDLISGIVVGLAAVLYYNIGDLPLWSIYALTIILSLISTLFQPAIKTVIPSIMKEEELIDANAFNSIVYTTSNLVSPLIGGFLMSFTCIGTILVLNSMSFIISAVTEMFIDMPCHHKTPDKMNLQRFKIDFKMGIDFIRHTKFLVTMGVIAFTLNFAISPVFSIAIPFILKKIMVIKDYEFGMLNAIVASASIIGGVMAASVTRRLTMNKILIIDFIAQPIIVGIITLITSSFILNTVNSYYLPLFLLGIMQYILIMIMTIGNVVVNTAFHKIIPNELLGRVSTVLGTLTMGSIPLGQGLYGIMLERFEPWVVMICSAILLSLVVTKSYGIIMAYDFTSSD